MFYIFSSPSQFLNEGTLLDLYFAMFHANMKIPSFDSRFVGFTFKKRKYSRLNSPNYGKKVNTVDGQNPAPPRMIIIPLFIGF